MSSIRVVNPDEIDKDPDPTGSGSHLIKLTLNVFLSISLIYLSKF